MVPGVVGEPYVLDIALIPGSKAVRAQLPKLSPQEAVKEQYHIRKNEKLAFLEFQTRVK